MKIPFKLIAVGALFTLFVWAAIDGPSFWRQYRIDKAIDALEAPYRNDTYGGKTPEETFDMFLDALEKGDLELASKYFIVRKQDEYKKRLEKMRSDGTLEKQIQEWKRARNEWERVTGEGYDFWDTHAVMRYKYRQEKEFKSIDAFGNEFVVEPGEYTAEIIFDLNELTKVWKITLL